MILAGCRRWEMEIKLRYLHDRATGRNNNFNLLRMVAASAVLVSHAYPISLGVGAAEPLESLLQISLGTLAVLTFFAISGFFISQSFDRRSSTLGFVVARVLRLYPALLLVLLVTTLVIGPIFTTLSVMSFFSSNATLLYLFKNLTLKWMQYDLPGVFRDNPYPAAINGSLWSLFYEVACYGLVVAIGLLGVTAVHWRFAIFLGACSAIYLGLKLFYTHSDTLVAIFQQLTLPFVIGMGFYQFRRFVPLNAIFCGLTGCGALLAYGTPWFQEIFVLFWSYFIFNLGYLSFGPLRMYNRIGDYSYGMYIFAFPCEQIGVAVWKGISPLSLIALSFPVTLGCAALSWHLIERRALAHRTVVGNWLERRLSTAANS
jgi:peptidoglycan/LPS O-acetylase OafA/YrhL